MTSKKISFFSWNLQDPCTRKVNTTEENDYISFYNTLAKDYNVGFMANSNELLNLFNTYILYQIQFLFENFINIKLNECDILFVALQETTCWKNTKDRNNQQTLPEGTQYLTTGNIITQYIKFKINNKIMNNDSTSVKNEGTIYNESPLYKYFEFKYNNFTCYMYENHEYDVNSRNLLTMVFIKEKSNYQLLNFSNNDYTMNLNVNINNIIYNVVNIHLRRTGSNIEKQDVITNIISKYDNESRDIVIPHYIIIIGDSNLHDLKKLLTAWRGDYKHNMYSKTQNTTNILATSSTKFYIKHVSEHSNIDYTLFLERITSTHRSNINDDNIYLENYFITILLKYMTSIVLCENSFIHPNYFDMQDTVYTRLFTYLLLRYNTNNKLCMQMYRYLYYTLHNLIKKIMIKDGIQHELTSLGDFYDLSDHPLFYYEFYVVINNEINTVKIEVEIDKIKINEENQLKYDVKKQTLYNIYSKLALLNCNFDNENELFNLSLKFILDNIINKYKTIIETENNNLLIYENFSIVTGSSINKEKNNDIDIELFNIYNNNIHLLDEWTSYNTEFVEIKRKYDESKDNIKTIEDFRTQKPRILEEIYKELANLKNIFNNVFVINGEQITGGKNTNNNEFYYQKYIKYKQKYLSMLNNIQK